MKKSKKLVMVLLVILAFVFAGVSETLGRGGRSGGGGSRSFSRKSSPVRKSFPVRKSSPLKKTVKKKTSAKRVATTSKRTETQQKSFEAAKKNGTAFKSKSEATSAFKSKNATKYTSKYATKPSTRPSHVPQTTMVNGTSCTINYNSMHGGYGYTNSFGAFIIYNAMADAIMVNTLMSRNNYYYDNRSTPVAVAITPAREFTTGIIFGLIIIVGLGIIIVVVYKKNKNG